MTPTPVLNRSNDGQGRLAGAGSPAKSTCGSSARAPGHRRARRSTLGPGGVYLEIAPPPRLVSTEVHDEPWYEGEATSMIVLTEAQGRTTLTMTVRYASRGVRDAVLQTPMAQGVTAGFERLQALLSSIDVA
ncbi:MAG TPA: SRPBCC domain-containing protein [Anaerolineales bacterium]|nr:SRPBCC domain-containing protein [Anaerolineales bacterium]